MKSFMKFMLLCGVTVVNIGCVKIILEPETPSNNTSTKVATFEKNIKPIFLTKCAPCHMAGGDRVNKWDNYQTVKTYITGIMGRVTRSLSDPLLMPKNGPKLSNEEIVLLRKWIDDGLLEK